MKQLKKTILTLVALLAVTTGAWAAEETVTWEGSTLESIDVNSYGTTKTQTIGDITITANSGYFQTTTDSWTQSKATTASAFEANGLVFSSEKNIKSVEVHASDDSTFGGACIGGVTSHTYTLTPAATSFAFPYGDGWLNITKIVFTLEEAAAEPTYAVTFAEGVNPEPPADPEWTASPAAGVKKGQTVTVTYSGSKKVIGVKAEKKASTVPVTAITLNKTATTITAGQTETLSVSSVTPDDATDQTVTWSSDNEAVATVDADGKVTAVALGTANITATANDGSGVTATCAVTVNKVVTINQSDWGSDYVRSFTKDGVTVSAGFIDPEDGNLMDDGSFSTTLGNFTKIVVTAQSCSASGTGWSGSRSSMTWTGTPASTVSFSGDFMGMGMSQTTIVCTIEPAN